MKSKIPVCRRIANMPNGQMEVNLCRRSKNIASPAEGLDCPCWLMLLSAAVVMVLPCLCRAQTTVVNVIPNGQSGETLHNTEPSIAVDPQQPAKMMISSFANFPHPYFSSQNGGTTWNLDQQWIHGDTTLAWIGGPGADGTAYTVMLVPPAGIGPGAGQPNNIPIDPADNPPTMDTVVVLRDVSPLLPPALNFSPLGVPSYWFSAGIGTDQPRINALRKNGADYLYVSLNDLGLKVFQPKAPAGQKFANAATASLHLSLNSGVAWNNFVAPYAGVPWVLDPAGGRAPVG